MLLKKCNKEETKLVKICLEISGQYLSHLLLKRKEEIFKIFSDHSTLTIDDKLLIGFLKFINLDGNKNHPILNEFKDLATKSKLAIKHTK